MGSLQLINLEFHFSTYFDTCRRMQRYACAHTYRTFAFKRYNNYESRSNNRIIVMRALLYMIEE